MGKRVKIQTDYTAEELHERYRQAKDAVERTHWHILWLAKEGQTPQVIAELLGYTARWVRTVIGRWNVQGEAGIRDRRHEMDVSRPLLSPEQKQDLAAALQAAPADGGLWSGPKVALWMQQRLGRPVAPQRGWDYLQRLGHSSRVPRPQHAKADEATQQEFKKTPGTGGPGAAPASPSQRRALDHG
jgi:transposase